MPEMAQHPFFDAREEIPAEKRKIGSIVVSADKGLAGSYNHNIFKLEEELLKTPGEHKLFVVGELGRHYFARRQVEVDTISSTRYRSRPCTGPEISVARSSSSFWRASWMRCISFTPAWKIP